MRSFAAREIAKQLSPHIFTELDIRENDKFEGEVIINVEEALIMADIWGFLTDQAELFHKF